MMTILKTSKFTKWIQELKDLKGKARIQARIDKLEFGHFGDCESIGSGVFELRIHFGPGYRVYLMKKRSRTCNSPRWRRQGITSQRYKTGN
jgi:putative addiction module killer protein